MSYWAEIDETNTVLRIIVGNNDDSNGDEGYQWIVNNLGGNWIKTSYNSLGGIHYLPDNERDENGKRIPSGKPHLRYNFAQVNGTYDPIRDAFIAPKPEIGDPSIWVLNEETFTWVCKITPSNQETLINGEAPINTELSE
jgi:hypothetical protein